MYSHYIMPLTKRRRDGTQLAACELFVFAEEHSTEPSCPECAAFLVADQQSLDDLRAEAPEFPFKPVAQMAPFADLPVSVRRDIALDRWRKA
jgi:hypothetical protein